MLLSFKNLKHSSVETSSGLKLGHVSDIILETKGQLAAQYEVKHSLISSKKYLLSRDQIVRFENKKIIVDDNVEKIANKTIEEKSPINPEPVSMRKNA